MPWNINSPKMTVFRLSCALTFIASVLFCTVTYINEIYRPPIVEGVGAATSTASARAARMRRVGFIGSLRCLRWLALRW